MADVEKTVEKRCGGTRNSSLGLFKSPCGLLRGLSNLVGATVAASVVTPVVRPKVNCLAAERAAVVDEGLVFLDGHCDGVSVVCCGGGGGDGV
jgi:hypothetical protein